MNELVLTVEDRPRSGTGGARETRSQGLVPGVVYGGDSAPQNIAVAFKDLKKAILAGGLRSHMLKISLKGAMQPVLVRDIQFHPVSDDPVHIDFYRIREGQIVAVEVPVHFENESLSPGIKRGGTLNVVRHTVELDCPANAIPEFITVSLEGLEIGSSVHISAVALPPGVSPTIRDRDFTIATIAGAVASTEAETATPVETEVIKKGKADEAGGDKK